MRKIVLTMAILLSMMIVGCGESTKVETPPWSDSQIQRMKNEEIGFVPLVIVRY